MADFADTHRRLSLLTEVAGGGKITQRSLAASLGIALGLANALLKECESEGLIRFRPRGEDGARYALTEIGRARMAHLAREFAGAAGELIERATGRPARLQCADRMEG